MTLCMHCQQHFLHHILHFVWQAHHPTPQEGAQARSQFGQELRVRSTVTPLSFDKQAVKTALSSVRGGA
jgi:hypothetical protein